MIFSEDEILKGSEVACGINLKDARELFDSRKDSPLNVTRHILNIINEYIEDTRSGYHNTSFYGVGVHEKIVSILEVNPKVLEDKVIKREIESNFVKLLCYDIENFYVSNGPLILGFMKKYLNCGNAFFKREPQQSLIYNAAKNGIKESLKSTETCISGAVDIVDFLTNYLPLSSEKIFSIPEDNEIIKKLTIDAMKFAISCGCTEEAISGIEFLEKNLGFDRNELKCCLNRASFKKAIRIGYQEIGCLPQNSQWMYDDMVEFATKYLGYPESNIKSFLDKIKERYLREFTE